MPDQSLEISQIQRRGLFMSAEMRRSIEILALPTINLREKIVEEAEKNPALEIRGDPAEIPDCDFEKPGDFGAEDDFSDDFHSNFDSKSFVENISVENESLQHVLLSQLAETPLDDEIRNFCELLIQNLDEHGFNIVPPENFFSISGQKKQLSHDERQVLQKSLDVVRHFEPSGTCFSSMRQFLLFQCEENEESPPIAAAILKDKDIPVEDLAKKTFASAFAKKMKEKGEKAKASEVEEAVDFIKTLRPFPASGFSQGQIGEAIPEILVSKDENAVGASFLVSSLSNGLPEVAVSQSFAEIARGKSDEGAALFAKRCVADAERFLQALNDRTSSVLRVVSAIVAAQKEFFIFGKSHLKPLTMAQIASDVNLSESTISRIARGKYLQCDWGIFEIRHFFSNSATSGENSAKISKPATKEVLRMLIFEAEKRGEKCSDEKLAKMLEEKGIAISRRTVAKYRSEMQLPSSFVR